MPAKNVASVYDAHIRRAERLISLHPFTQEVLTFYKKIAEFQKSLHTQMLSGNKPQGTGKNLPALRENLKINGPRLGPVFCKITGLLAVATTVPTRHSTNSCRALFCSRTQRASKQIAPRMKPLHFHRSAHCAARDRYWACFGLKVMVANGSCCVRSA